jgi:superfamily I DNA/RNA helicase
VALAGELKEIIEIGGLAQGGVTILSPEPFESSTVSLLPERVRESIEVLDEFSMRTFPPGRVSFAQISSFKGLENEAVIVVDLPTPSSDGLSRALHYVAMSRARALLSIIAIN